MVDEIEHYVRSPAAATFEQSTVFVRTPIVRFVGADGRDPTRARIGPESIPRVNRRMAGAVWTLMCVLFVPFAALFGFIGAVVLTG